MSLSSLQPRFVLTGGCTESQCGSFRYLSSAAGAPLGGNEDSNWERKETIRLLGPCEECGTGVVLGCSFSLARGSED